MAKKDVVQGAVFVALGATFYGVLGNVIKLAYRDGYSTAEITAAQYGLGLLGLLLINLVAGGRAAAPPHTSGRDRRQLVLAGTAIGVTSVSYYISMLYIDVSVAIVLMMQSVWFGIVLEAILAKRFPSRRKAIATVAILLGTVLATNLLGGHRTPDLRGLLWGLFSGATFTFMMFASNRIAVHVPPFRKSLLMLAGGSLVVAAFVLFTRFGPATLAFGGAGGAFDLSILYTYGPVIALFGTIIPPIFFNIGFPRVGLGWGSILSSLELPVSVTVAYLVLREQVLAVQWTGIALILAAIVYLNRGRAAR